MDMRLGESIRNRPGGCPDGQMLRGKYSSGPVSGLSSGTDSKQSRAPAGTGRPDDHGDLRYEHTQVGTLLILAVMAVIVIILASMFLYGPVPVPLLVLCLMAFLLAIMSHLTVSVSADTIRIRFGPVGLVQKEWRLIEIVSATPVTNPWYYGYGLRWTPHGPLYNIAGRTAVEILLQSGKKVRIGTDEPEALAEAIRQAIR
jgi:hypothetical protein